MYYRVSRYCCDNSTAIMAFNDMGEAECSVTINLSDYGLKPESDDHIYIPYYKIGEYSMELMNQIITDLVDEVKQEVFIGYKNSCKCLYVKLKSNWKDICENCN